MLGLQTFFYGTENKEMRQIWTMNFGDDIFIANNRIRFFDCKRN